MTRNIELSDYTPQWAEAYKQEAICLKTLLGRETVRIHHIGSTAIPNIKAKPVIDMLIEVLSIKKLDTLNERFKTAGYEIKGECGIPGRRFFQKGTSQPTYHVHAYQTKHPEIARHLHFRDILLTNTTIAKEYERLKIHLASIYHTDRLSYTEGKSAFIRSIE